MIVILDNYDSFTYNLYQYLGELDPDIKVVRNDALTVEKLKKLPLSHLVISPGPGFPQQAGVSVEAIRALSGIVPILGVCLGHQAIGVAFGGNVVHAPRLMHGKASAVALNESEIFEGLPPVIRAGRYHSLIVDKCTLPRCLKVTAQTVEGEVMALQHEAFPVFGLQFHPESILTPEGRAILKNFLSVRVKGGKTDG